MDICRPLLLTQGLLRHDTHQLKCLQNSWKIGAVPSTHSNSDSSGKCLCWASLAMAWQAACKRE